MPEVHPAAAPRRGALTAPGRLTLAAVAVAALSALVVAPAPSYDPWAWLLWGREVAAGTLSTQEGPAFKPLPVAVCALLSVLGGAAPAAWVIVARAGFVLAVVLAFRLGRDLVAPAGGDPGGGSRRPVGAAGESRRLSGSRRPVGAAGESRRLPGGESRRLAAGVLAAAGVALCGGLIGYSAGGAEPGWTIALALLAIEAWRAGRPRAALACGVGCALLRVEAWPFLLAAGIVLWRRRPQDRWLLAGCAAAVPALWLVPELIGSGDVLRSGARARVPNPGQPAEAAVPALAALREAAALPLWPLWAGAAASLALPAARRLVAAGLAWIALVAAMAQAGFSGEPRYSLPGGALVAIAGAAGLVALARAAAARDEGRRATPAPGLAVAALLLVAAVPKLADLPDLRRDQAWQAGLADDLSAAIRTAGGREALLACGRPYVGRYRGPLLAYQLDVEKRRVGFDPRPPGAVFRSRLHAADPAEPAATPGFARLARAGRWEVRAAC